MKFHAMIGKISYLDTQADNEDQARANFAVALHHRGEGIYKRWRDAGMRVAVFNRGINPRDRAGDRKLKHY